MGDAGALGKSLDGRDDRLRPKPGAFVVDYGAGIVHLMRRPEVVITVDCRERFGDAGPWARLILAAPDLLSALIQMLGSHNRVNTRTRDLCECRDCLVACAAIAKATGA